ncbi:hypothetical protein [Microtetraspora niveoalba]|uniref:hypothetical protein n=1 Tax=Microtetraspora niveoalba TaxID=46175 RepID=UPI00082DD4D2|nr:hypothetical protein [Microtetraspora niveoalba]
MNPHPTNTDPTDPHPTAPHPAAPGVTARHPHRPWVVAGGWAAAALLIGYAATGVAFDILLLIMKGISLLTGDQADLGLNLELDWLASGSRIASLVAGTAVAFATVRHRRRSLGACARCGRPGTGNAQGGQGGQGGETGELGQSPSTKGWSGWDALGGYTRHAGYACALLAGAYGVLKAQWGLGGTFGLDDPHTFGDDVHLWTPGLGDTAVLGLIGVALGIGFARTWTPRFIPRWMPLTAAFVGSVMSISTGLIGTGMAVASGLGLLAPPNRGDLGGISAWVFQAIYPVFLLWGLTMAVAAIGYHYRTRGRCATCGLA